MSYHPFFKLLAEWAGNIMGGFIAVCIAYAILKFIFMVLVLIFTGHALCIVWSAC